MAKTADRNDNFIEEAQSKSFPAMVFEMISEQKPTPEQEKLFELILNLCLDHGPDSPSAQKTIEAAQAGQTMGQSVGVGMAEIGDRHGGAMKPAMEFMLQVQAGAQVKELVQEYLDQEKLIGGYGHRIYKDQDPRAELILEKLGETGAEFTGIARQIEKALEEVKEKKLVLNIDGAIAVVLLTWGWSPDLGPGVFLAARAAGLCGQYLNNKAS